MQEDYGYSIAQTGGNVTGIKVYQKGKEVNATNAVKVEKSTEENITVVLQGANKYVELNGMYYPISLSGSEITVGEGENLTPSNSNLTITGASKVTATVTGLTIKLTGGATTGDDTLTITYGDKNATVKATVTETGAGVGGGSEPEEPAVTYTVIFNTNGGSSVDAQTIQSGGKATKPSTSPTREGYYFIEWFSDSGLTTEYDFNTSVNADTTIYAKWVEKITFYVGTTTYHAQSGMNWSQWIDSGMEGSNQFRYDNALVKDNTGFERYLDNVSPTSQIQNGATYSWSTGGGGGA